VKGAQGHTPHVVLQRGEGERDNERIWLRGSMQGERESTSESGSESERDCNWMCRF